MKAPSKRDIILVGIIALCFTLIGVGLTRLFMPKIVPVDNSLIIKTDSLNRLIRDKDLSIHKLDSIVESQIKRLSLRDSLYIQKHIRDKDEIKYIKSLDSTGISNRLDSILKGAKLR